MAEHYHGNCVTNVIKHYLIQNGSTILWHASKLLHYFDPRKTRVNITAVIYLAVFIEFASG